MNTKRTSNSFVKLKVMTIVGTRPEIIRLSRTIVKLDEYFEHILVHTGQNFDFELNQVFFDELEIRSPNIFLDCAMASPAETIAEVIRKSDQILDKYKPDAVLILGDTNSSLAAISAKRRKVPIFHMEAGNRCFNLNVPEEINRKIVDHISDINMPYSDIAREYLLSEGIKPETIIKTGSPMDEVLDFYKEKINGSNIIQELKLEEGAYFIVSVHREENVDDRQSLEDFSQLLNSIAQQFELPIIVSAHPRTRKRLASENFSFSPLIQFKKPLGFFDYIKLQKNSKAVLSDSGTITEESSILNFPAINLREVHERPEGMEEGAVMFTGMNTKRVMQGLKILDYQSRNGLRNISKVKDYIAPNVSEKVARMILSYTDFVNKNIWQKQSNND
jgi:UDP-N-acetylglucosamine 2-epimerase (non-hydrolysing)